MDEEKKKEKRSRTFILGLGHISPASFAVFWSPLGLCWHATVWRRLSLLIVFCKGEQSISTGVAVGQTKSHICVFRLREQNQTTGNHSFLLNRKKHHDKQLWAQECMRLYSLLNRNVCYRWQEQTREKVK